MTIVRIALANLRIPSTPDESVSLATAAIADAGRSGAKLLCFPECYVPGYRGPGSNLPAPNKTFLEDAWSAIASYAGDSGVAVVLATERVTSRGLLISALVINADGTVAGWQDKEQIDPSEESTYIVGEGRRVFQAGPLTFGIVAVSRTTGVPKMQESAAVSSLARLEPIPIIG